MAQLHALSLLPLLSLPAQTLQEAFQADPRALLTSAKSGQADAGDDAVILLDDHHYSFDKQGRLTRTHRQIYFLRKAAAAEDWSTINVDWAPWHQERPRLEARVIAADGVVHQLDAKTIAEAPTHQFDATIFSDQRVLQAPLPAISEGAVARETAPESLSGGSRLACPGAPRPHRRGVGRASPSSSASDAGKWRHHHPSRLWTTGQNLGISNTTCLAKRPPANFWRLPRARIGSQ